MNAAGLDVDAFSRERMDFTLKELEEERAGVLLSGDKLALAITPHFFNLIPRENPHDPIRRQMLGWGVNANGFYTPTDDDVPLRVWLRELGGDPIGVGHLPDPLAHPPGDLDPSENFEEPTFRRRQAD